MVGDLQVLDLEPARAVEQQHDHLGEIDRAAGVGDRELLELVLDLGLLAHPRGVDQPHRPHLAVRRLPFPVDRDRIAGDPGFRPGDQPFLLDDPVDQGRFAGIGPADDGELERRIALLVRAGLGLVALDMRPQMLEQVDHALAMLGAHRDRLAETERPGFEDAGLAGRGPRPCWRRG